MALIFSQKYLNELKKEKPAYRAGHQKLQTEDVKIEMNPLIAKWS